jgi:hypothetical protein
MAEKVRFDIPFVALPSAMFTAQFKRGGETHEVKGQDQKLLRGNAVDATVTSITDACVTPRVSGLPLIRPKWLLIFSMLNRAPKLLQSML